MTPKEECEILLDALLSASKHLLKKNKKFYPIGAVLENDDEATYTAVESVDEYPDSKSVLQKLISVHKQKATSKEIKASGIAWNATVTSDDQQCDAIIVSLEHQDDYSVVVGLPYKIGLFKKFKFGELFAQEGNKDVF